MEVVVLFVGDDWAVDHHDVEIQDHTGRRLATARLEEGVAGVARLHELIATHAGELPAGEVLVGIETDRGLWVQALIAAGYRVFAINPRQAARFRERHAMSGAKSDARDAHMLADMVRTDAHQLRAVAGDSALVEAIKALTRAHQNLIRDRTRRVQRLRAVLRESFPAALAAFEDLTATDALELLGKAPDADTAARLTRPQIAAALRRARRYQVPTKTERLREVLRSPQLTAPVELADAHALLVRAHVRAIAALNVEITVLAAAIAQRIDRHPAAVIYLSQPGLGPTIGARVLAEFGDDPTRYASAKARKNYAGTSPVTRQSGRKTVIAARYVNNNRLVDALHHQAQCALTGSPGARAYYDHHRQRGAHHQAALRQVANRLVGILHGCLKTGSPYEEATAWPLAQADHEPVGPERTTGLRTPVAS